jgi:plasmid stabilization system protein ParE
MAHRLDWSPSAIEDIDAIASTIAGDQPSHAEAFVLNVASAAESIAERPESGRAVPELGQEEIRERFVYNYRVAYKVEPDRVVILTVIRSPAAPAGLFQAPIRSAGREAAAKPPPTTGSPPPKGSKRRRSA